MTQAPFDATISVRQTAVVERSPYSVVLVLPKEAAVPAPAAALTVIGDATAAEAQLGDTTKTGRQWYDYLEAQANIDIAALPFTPDSDDAQQATNINAALQALLSAGELAKLRSGVDLVVVPDDPGKATAASSIVTQLETVCADKRVLANGITDGYHGSAAHADALSWAQANRAADVLAISNRAPVSGVSQWGSIIAAGHICRYSATRGVGSHPFNLSDQIIGVGTPAPERAFSLDDGSASAEALADAFLSSIITYDGAEYLWGGTLGVADDSDPRINFGNAVLAHRIVKRAKRIAAPFFGRRATSFTLADVGLAVRLGLQAEFGALTSSIIVGTPTIAGTTVTVPMIVGFHNFIKRIQLAAEVYLSS